MPGTITPSQMFDHELNPVKGWPSPTALDKTVKLDSGVTGVVAGMVLHIDVTSGKAQKGAESGQMPLFAFQSQNDFDVNGDVGNIISNNINCLVATGPYELETTEYTSTGFNPNIPVYAPNATGKITATTFSGGKTICGVVSDAGPITNAYGKSVIRFWSVYVPVNS